MQNKEYQPKIAVPQIHLPAGGGAIKGLGETFQPNAFSGTGNLSIPIYTSPCRDFEPKLSLDYHSAAGNGPFGLGISLSLPNISLKTEKKLPRYDALDTFILSNMEDLVAGESRKEGIWTITFCRPRIEGSFARIEYWQCPTESFWRITTKENSTSVFGKSENTRICDPENNMRIFQWLLEETYDARGNKIKYTYRSENSDNVADEICERNRSHTANKYLQSIRYGNYAAHGQELWAFEVVFDYGEYNTSLDYLGQKDCNPYEPVQKWMARADSFSTYRSGFEIRCHRLCRNILMFHHLPEELGEKPCLVHATSLEYLESPALTRLKAVSSKGYQRKTGGSYQSKAMPSLELGYSAFDLEHQEFKLIQLDTGGSIPGRIEQSEYNLVDLYGEGIEGFLCSNNYTTLYWQPKGNGQYQAPEPPVQFPIDRDFRLAEYSLISLEGNGKLDLVVGTAQRGGFYECNPDGSWEGYRDFSSYPLDYVNPYKNMVDLDGDSIPEIMVIEQQNAAVYTSLKKEGYAASQRVLLDADFPQSTGTYQEEIVTFADLFGDGLSHRVRIQNGCVECWPHLGYGKFGKKVILGNSPFLGDMLDASRLFLADIDGSGTIDIIYAYYDRVEVYLNQSGNTFSAKPLIIDLPEPLSNIDQISFGDMNGNGTSCLIFTKISPEVKHYYYDFAGAAKPYLLNEISNNMGAVTRIQYASAVQYYLEDKKSGHPWKTKLPFPVQVVEKSESIDLISGSKLVTSYRYHDGCYDYQEREFRGFGFVEQWDTEDFDSYNQPGLLQAAQFTAIEKDVFVPPVYTKHWYHTGVFLENDTISSHYREQYYTKDEQAYDLPDSSFDQEIMTGDAETLRQAYRALKGQLLREEIYALDERPGISEHPYTVAESSFHVRLVQPGSSDLYPVFLVHDRESIHYQYERNAKDPRIEHHFVLEVDAFANTAKACQVYYPRRIAAYPEQAKLQATAVVSSFINKVEDFWLHSVAYENKTYEIGGLQLEQGQSYFSFDNIRHQIATEALANSISHEEAFTPGKKQARLLSWGRDYYWNSSQDTALQPGEITAQALLHHSAAAIFSEQYIKNVLKDKETSELLEEGGGYYLEDGCWWNRGLVNHYYKEQEQKFFLVWKVENSFAEQASSLFSRTTMEYDPYCLAITRVQQYLSETDTNDITVLLDYTCLKPTQMKDINDNIAQVIFDPLGMVIATSSFGTVEGKPGGDMNLKDYLTDTNTTFDKVLNSIQPAAAGNPNPYLQEASTYFYYDLFAFSEKKQPSRYISLIRETHASELQAGEEGRIQVHISYTDGFGREIENKVKIDPGEAFVRDDNTGMIETVAVAERYIASGRTVYNNKGKPIKQYQPFFSAKPDYEAQKQVEDLLPEPSLIHYDPLLRQIRLDTPKGKLPDTAVLGFYAKVEFTPWEESHFDQNDTIKDSDYYNAFQQYVKNNPNLSENEKDEKDALEKAAHFYNTPQSKVMDNLGRPFLHKQDNLGEIVPDLFSALTAKTTIKSEELWSELKDRGYIEIRESGGWLTEKFQPYSQGFTLELADKYKQFAASILDILRQSCLTSYQQFDIQGRVLLSIDPRLYYANTTQQTKYYNFKYSYDMVGQQPLLTDSIDAGSQLHLSNMFGNLLWSWSARNFNQRIYYDNLQRKVLIRVRDFKDDGTFDNDNAVEVFTYGEIQANAADKNLRGQLYELKDQSGIVVNSLFGIEGELLQTSRQLTAEYKRYINWDQDVLLAPEVYTGKFTYDALKRMLTERTPDSTVTINTYNQAGLLDAVSVRYADGSEQTVINHTDYDADGLRLAISYANGIKTIYTYEATTKHLLKLQSSRPGKDRKGNSRTTLLQDISYTYDPAANLTRIRDKSIQTVFNNNQMVEPLSDYTYDALYRLIRARGRQHSGINAGTYINSRKNSDFKQSKFASLNDGEKLENYTEKYRYDEAGNLIETAHTASNSWTRRLEMQGDSNRLKTITNQNGSTTAQQISYDRSGNQTQLNLYNTVRLTWNCCENLIQANVIQRPDEEDDSDYYNYDSQEQRTRKIAERLASANNWQEEKIYLGNYEIKRIKQGSLAEKTILERQTLRIMDDYACAAIIHYWVKDDNKSEVEKDGTRKIRYQMGNHLSSISLEVDDTANLISYEEYFPYGGTAIIAGDNQKEVELKEYRYSGKECDDSTGLYYYGARYYAPWLGRWLKPDPAGTVDGLNLYAFVGGNPVNSVDVDGKIIFFAKDFPRPKFKSTVKKFAVMTHNHVTGSNVSETESLTARNAAVPHRMAWASLRTNVLKYLNHADTEAAFNRWTDRFLKAADEDIASSFNEKLKAHIQNSKKELQTKRKLLIDAMGLFDQKKMSRLNVIAIAKKLLNELNSFYSNVKDLGPHKGTNIQVGERAHPNLSSKGSGTPMTRQVSKMTPGRLPGYPVTPGGEHLVTVKGLLVKKKAIATNLLSRINMHGTVRVNVKKPVWKP